jgi:hypothetical protein
MSAVLSGIGAAAGAFASQLIDWFCLARKDTDDQSGITVDYVTFDKNVPDQSNTVHSTSSNTSRFTPPNSWNGRYVLFRGQVNSETTSAAANANAQKNGASYMGGGFHQTDSGGTEFINVISSPVTFSPGDYFQLEASSSGGFGITADERTWAQLQLMASTYAGVLVQRSGNQAISAGATTAIQWNGTDVYDTNSYHDPASNNTRLQTQTGDSLVILRMNCQAATTGQMVLSMTKNGAGFSGNPQKDSENTSATEYICIQSAVIPVTGGTDYFEGNIFLSTAVDLVAGNQTWMNMEVLDPATKYCVVRLTSSEDIGTTFEELAWDAAAGSESGWWSAGSPTRITVDEDGWYEQSFSFLSASATGQFAAKGQIDGADYHGMPYQDTDTAGTDSVNAVGAIRYLTAGQYFTVQVEHTGGGDVQNSNATWMCVRKIEALTS